MAEVVFKNVSKSFGSEKVIENLDLVIPDGKFTVLVGSSGCGKTTLLRMIAGIGPQSSGKIFLDGRDITHVPPGKRDVAMVFQNYAIYPTMTVEANITFGLENKHVPKEERKRLVEEVCEVVGLTKYLKRKPNTLSGGQRQRIALARAMVKKPKVFLMDEPLSNLDAKLRSAMRSELIELQHKLNTTFVYVTHDQSEAMSMADKIVVMEKGKIMQEATAEVIYNDPENVFTARFIGVPPMNICPIRNINDKIGFRPEKIILSETPTNFAYCRKGTIVTREFLGSETLYKIETEDGTIMVKSTNPSFIAGREIYLNVDAGDLYFFDAEGKRIRDRGVQDFLPVISLNGGR